MSDLHDVKDALVVTAFWEARSGEAEEVAALLRAFEPLVQREPGVLAFRIHRAADAPERFFFYEVFRDEAAFAAHQKTEHFRRHVQEGALPRLARRERSQYRFV